jgi:hypothetical protein
LETKFGYFLLLAPLVPEIYIAYTENIFSKIQSCRDMNKRLELKSYQVLPPLIAELALRCVLFIGGKEKHKNSSCKIKYYYRSRQ